MTTRIRKRVGEPEFDSLCRKLKASVDESNRWNREQQAEYDRDHEENWGPASQSRLKNNQVPAPAQARDPKVWVHKHCAYIATTETSMPIRGWRLATGYHFDEYGNCTKEV